MSLLLCQKDAENPFYSETLDLRLWSLQELCYVIYNHPLLALRDFDGNELLLFLRKELGLSALSDRLAQAGKGNAASPEEAGAALLTALLRESGFYTPAEAEACRSRMEAYQNGAPEDREHAEGLSLFRLERYRLSEESFRRELAIVSEQARRARSGKERDALLVRKADICCSLAAVRVRLFDEAGALRLLAEADEAAPGERAARFRYLLGKTAPDDGAEAGLTDEEKKSLSGQKETARQQALLSPRYREAETAAALPQGKREEALGAMLRQWKKEYRRMK